MRPRPSRLPVSTYRLQLRPGFGFREATGIVPYLHALGITDVYASPLLAARAGSRHGYDVTDPTRLNPALGSREEFEALADALARRGMGLILDIVPNHMAADAANPWWWDVLKLGRASRYASWFDIDWTVNEGRIVLPVLGADLAETVRRGEPALGAGEDGLEIRYHERRFPLSPSSVKIVLDSMGELRCAGEALHRVADAARAMPGRDAAERAPEPYRAAAERLDAALREWFRDRPDAAVLLSAARLEPAAMRALLQSQHYSLEFWKDGLRRINYRRFFDVGDLVGVRAESPEVFGAMHGLVLDLIRDGAVSGLRVDHVDGLHDPRGYLERLSAAASRAAAGDESAAARPVYIVAEKILARDERVRSDWPVAGETGYAFVNAVTRVGVDPAGFAVLEEHAAGAAGMPDRREAAFAAKREVLESLFPAELAVLTGRLVAIAMAAGSRLSRDALREALVCVTASMGVYRTYIVSEPVADEDRRRIEEACAAAERRTDAGAVGLVRDVLLLRPAKLAEEGLLDRVLSFVMRWQQLTGPVMAKGVEDTLLYRRIVLASLNEVGGEPDPGADPVEEFHRLHLSAAAERAWTMTATSTHDTKRSEDARARLSVLSEIAPEWAAAVDRWRGMNEELRAWVGGAAAPGAADELLVYQSLLAVWPLASTGAGRVPERIREYMLKAAREAKVRTSWTEPNEEYESAVRGFVDGVLDAGRSGGFLAEFLAIQRRVAFHGMLNALSQTLLKLASPGVPDTYQGTEVWDLSLVDPDNRRAVDFSARREALESLRGAMSERGGMFKALREGWRDGRVKLWVTTAGLHARRERAGLFLDGAYIPLEVRGRGARNVVAFARRGEGAWAVAVVPRLTVGLGEGWPLGAEVWRDTEVVLPEGAPGEWRDAVSGAEVLARAGAVRLGRALREMPVALLLGDSARTAP